MATVKIAGIGASYITGNYGNYTVNSDGTFTVDSRDAPALIAQNGGAYLSTVNDLYALLKAPLTAAVGQIAASAALSNGALAIANQPDVMRQARMRIDPGTVALSAGAVNMTYLANDFTTLTESLSVATPASTIFSKAFSKGVLHISTITISGVAGGASPVVQIDTTTTLCVPVAAGAVDFTLVASLADGTYEATQGTASTTTLGGFTPNTAPNGTHTFAAAVSYNAPNI